jgi:prefoldin subunit 5
LVRLILKETIGRDEETLVLIRVIVEVSGYIDTLQDTMNALEKRLQKVDSTKSKVRKIEKLAKKHDEVYRALDEILKQRVKTADEETAYVQ